MRAEPRVYGLLWTFADVGAEWSGVTGGGRGRRSKSGRPDQYRCGSCELRPCLSASRAQCCGFDLRLGAASRLITGLADAHFGA